VERVASFVFVEPFLVTSTIQIGAQSSSLIANCGRSSPPPQILTHLIPQDEVLTTKLVERMGAMRSLKEFEGEDVALILNSLASLGVVVPISLCNRFCKEALSPPSKLNEFTSEEVRIILANLEALEYPNGKILDSLRRVLHKRGEEVE
jgi:hypothetical protein